MKASTGISIFAFAAIACATLFAQSDNPSRLHQLKSLRVAKLSAAGHPIDAWIMDSEQKRQEGMMFLTDKEVKSNQGMIFLFSAVQPGDRDHSFWMEHTLIPLDIIYVNRAKTVINIGDGKVLDRTPVLAKGAYMYVVELKAGTAKKLGIKPGTKFQIPDALKSAD